MCAGTSGAHRWAVGTTPPKETAMNLLEEYLAQARMDVVRDHAEAAYHRRPRRARRRTGLSRHRAAPPSG
jgi:hypothetical protein